MEVNYSMLAKDRGFSRILPELKRILLLAWVPWHLGDAPSNVVRNRFGTRLRHFMNWI
jgi:hypothetical protein